MREAQYGEVQREGRDRAGHAQVHAHRPRHHREVEHGELPRELDSPVARACCRVAVEGAEATFMSAQYYIRARRP